MADDLPPCGIYRTTAAIADVPTGRLVYFHNHGDPGPGIYLPSAWQGNRAQWQERGHTLPDDSAAVNLAPLVAEGLYRVTEPFYCCDKNCRLFEPDSLVQLGYDAAATPILFTPELSGTAIALPDRGTRIDEDRTQKLVRLKVPTAGQAKSNSSPPPDRMLH